MGLEVVTIVVNNIVLLCSEDRNTDDFSATSASAVGPWHLIRLECYGSSHQDMLSPLASLVAKCPSSTRHKANSS